jgi:hypothetical protein
MSFLPALAGGLGAGLASGGIGLLGSLFGGGGKKQGPTEYESALSAATQQAMYGGGGGGGGGGGATAAPIDYYALFGAQAAAANNPLTAAMQGLATLTGAYGGALGLEGNTIASSQLSVLKEALDQAQKKSATQASITAAAAGAGIDTAKNLAAAKLSTELAGPNYLAQAGSASLAGENELAKTLAQSNIGLKTLQEQTRAEIAAQQAGAVASAFKTRANTEGSLALGSQGRETALQLEQARTLGDLTKIKAQTKSQLAIKQFGANQALAGQRFFA